MLRDRDADPHDHVRPRIFSFAGFRLHILTTGILRRSDHASERLPVPMDAEQSVDSDHLVL